MNCDKCNAEVHAAHLTPLGVCCAACLPAIEAEWDEICEREASTPLDEGPDQYDLEAFEQFALRVALHFLAQPGTKAKIQAANPIMAAPTELALWFKEQLIKQLPAHFSTWEARGHERLFHGGTFRVIGTIPREELFDAAIRAGILTPRSQHDGQEKAHPET